MKLAKLSILLALTCVLSVHAEDKWADPKWDAPWTKGLNWIGPNTYLWFDPVTKRNIEVTTPRGIDGCNAGLVRFEKGYVCRSRIPPPPPPRRDPEPIYVPPADAVCRGDYPVESLYGEDEVKCASGYIRRNRSHQDNAWCEMTDAQKAVCTPIYPPPEPDPGPGHDYGHQIGYRGPDGQLHETRDPNSPPCGNCKDGGPTDTKDDPNTTDTSPPGDGSTDGNTDGDGTGGE